MQVLGCVPYRYLFSKARDHYAAQTSSYTVADTCLVLLFFLEFATGSEYKAVLIFATCFEYLQRV